MMEKITNKNIIAIILITLVLVLGVSAQPTQASLPGQTVPTVGPTGHKSSNGSNNSNESSTSTPVYAPGSFITSTQTPTLTSQATEMTGGYTLAAPTGTNTANQQISATSATPEQTSVPVTKLIPVVLSSTPASSSSLYCVYSFIIVSILLFIFFLIRRRRPLKSTDENKPNPE
jgi:hypothetical protein